MIVILPAGGNWLLLKMQGCFLLKTVPAILSYLGRNLIIYTYEHHYYTREKSEIRKPTRAQIELFPGISWDKYYDVHCEKIHFGLNCQIPQHTSLSCIRGRIRVNVKVGFTGRLKVIGYRATITVPVTVRVRVLLKCSAFVVFPVDRNKDVCPKYDVYSPNRKGTSMWIERPISSSLSQKGVNSAVNDIV